MQEDAKAKIKSNNERDFFLYKFVTGQALTKMEGWRFIYFDASAGNLSDNMAT